MKIIGFPMVFFDFLYNNQRSAYKTNCFEPKNQAFHTFHTFHGFCSDSMPVIWSGAASSQGIERPANFSVRQPATLSASHPGKESPQKV